MTEVERQLMCKANAGGWNAWLGKDAMEKCHLQGTERNELQTMVSEVKFKGIHDCASWDISIPTSTMCVEMHLLCQLQQNSCNFNLVLPTIGVRVPWMCASPAAIGSSHFAQVLCCSRSGTGVAPSINFGILLRFVRNVRGWPAIEVPSVHEVIHAPRPPCQKWPIAFSHQSAQSSRQPLIGSGPTVRQGGSLGPSS